MKKIYVVILLLLLPSMLVEASAYKRGTCDVSPPCRLGQKGKFKRSYRHFKRGEASRVEGSLTVDASDFANHIKTGNKRTLTYYEDSAYYIPMGIGIIDTEGTTAQEWTIPDYDWISSKDQFDYEHIALSEARSPEFYPEATHVVHNKTVDEYEFLELTDEDLFMLGFDKGETDPIDYYTTISPIPLSVGEGFTGIVTLVYSEDPTYDSTQYIQDYDVVGYGTLTTPEGGSFEALKLIFTERGLDYTKDGEEVEDFFYEEIVWYTKEGYYVRMGIDDAWETEGEAQIDYIITQRVEINEEVTATKDEVASTLTKLYPNPVKAGETLLLDLPDNIQVSQIELFDLQGRSVAVAQANAAQGQKLEVAVPEGLAEGMYFYKAMLEGGERFVSGRVLVE